MEHVVSGRSESLDNCVWPYKQTCVIAVHVVGTKLESE